MEPRMNAEKRGSEERALVVLSDPRYPRSSAARLAADRRDRCKRRPLANVWAYEGARAMLTFFKGGGGRYCDRLSPRGFLKVGALAGGGLTLAGFFPVPAAEVASRRA